MPQVHILSYKNNDNSLDIFSLELFGQTLYRILAKQNPEVFNPFVSLTAANMAMFYQDNKLDREQSLGLVIECIQAGLPFLEVVPSIRNCMKLVVKVVQKWDLDFDVFFEENFAYRKIE